VPGSGHRDKERLLNEFLKVLWILVLAPALAAGAAAETQQKSQAGSKEQGKQANRRAAKPNLSKDASLTGISEFKIRKQSFDTAFPRLRTTPFVEIINPFSVRKRGRFYGSVYLYHRNDFFDARNFFDPAGEKLPEFKRNQFGASLGAFITPKLQVFGTYNGLRINKGSTITSLVPTPQMRMGDFGELLNGDTPLVLIDPLTGDPFPGNVIPQSRLHPVSLRMLPTIPEPNRPDYYPYYTNNQPSVDNNNTITGRVDYEFSRTSKLFGNWSFTNGDAVNVNPLPEFSTDQTRRSQNIALSYIRNFGSQLVSTFNLTFQRRIENALSKHAFQSGLLESLGINGVEVQDDSEEGYPEMTISGYPSLGQSRRNQSPRTSYFNEFGFKTNFTYVRGDHKFNFGMEAQNYQLNNYRTGGERRGKFGFYGQFTGYSLADFMLGIPASATRGLGSDRQDFRQRTWKAYIRDDWKINPRFSLSLGITYNYFPVAHSVHNNVSLFWPLVFEPPADGQIVVTGSPEAEAAGLTGLKPGHAVFPDKNDWQPSLGLAYSPLGNNKLVIRGSYGWNYRYLDLMRTIPWIGRNHPFYWRETASSPDAPAIDMSDPFQASAPAEIDIRALHPNMRSSYIQEWQLSIQNEFIQNWNMEVRYQGTRALRVGVATPGNVPLPGEGLIQERRPNPGIGQFSMGQSSASSIGHALHAELQKRLTRGFSIRSNFTWDRTFSNAVPGGNPSNPRDLRAERAVSSYSPKRFSINYIWDLPIGRDRPIAANWAGKLRFLLEGWRISGITRIVSGTPFHPQLGGDWNNDGVSGDRPDRLGSGRLSSADRSIAGWFAVNDFDYPEQYGFGNCGKNILLNPGTNTWDISLIKQTRLSEGGSALELRIQFFNAFNHTNFERPGTTLGTSTFGIISNAKDAREIEIALKYTF